MEVMASDIEGSLGSNLSVPLLLWALLGAGNKTLRP